MRSPIKTKVSKLYGLSPLKPSRSALRVQTTVPESQGLSQQSAVETTEEEVETQEDLPVAGQMEVEMTGGSGKDKDKDRYKKQQEAHAAHLNIYKNDYFDETRGSSSEDIMINMKEAHGEEKFQQVLSSPEEILQKINTKDGSYFLGSAYDFDTDKSHKISKKESVKEFPYGNIRRRTKKNGYISTITIDAKNHPLYGNTYTRTSKLNKERNTMKPIKDLHKLFKDYRAVNEEEYGFVDYYGIRELDGEAKWRYDATLELIKDINKNGYVGKSGDNLNENEKADLIKRVKKISARMKNSYVHETVLNKK